MTRQVGLHAKFTGDAGNLASASKLAAFELNKVRAEQAKLKREQQQAAAQAEAAANSTEAYAKRLHQLRMETDGAYAAMDRFRRSAALVHAAQERNAISASEAGQELQRLARHYGVAEAAGYSMNEQIRAGRFHTANMAAQFNDIGVMMASGQSPFITAIQQGTQLNQILGDMGGTARERFAAIGQSMLSVVSPANLLTIGLIAGASALVQWGLSAWNASRNTEQLKARAEELKRVTDALTESTESLRIQNEMLNSVSTSTQEFLAREQLNAAIKEQARLEAEIQALLDAGRRRASAARIASLKEQKEAAAASEAELRQIIQNHEQQKLIEMAVRRRANEYRNLARAEAAERQRVTQEHAKQVMEMGRARAAQEAMNIAAQAALGKFANMRTVAAGVANELERGANAAIKMAQQQASLNYGKIMNTGQSGPDAARRSVMSINAPGLLTGTLGTGAAGAFEPSRGGRGGGGGGADNGVENELTRLQESLMTQEQLEIESYKRRQEVLDQALRDRLISQEEYQKLMEQVNETHQFKMLQSTNRGVSDTLSALGSLFQGSKKIGAAVALANSWIAFTEVLKDPAYVGRPWARIAAASKALASGLNAVRNIKSANPGSAAGAAGGGGADAGAEAAAPPPQVQTLNFTIQNDPWGIGARLARDLAAQLNEAQRNGNTLIRATVG